MKESPIPQHARLSSHWTAIFFGSNAQVYLTPKCGQAISKMSQDRSIRHERINLPEWVEANFRILLDAAPDAMLVVDDRGTIVLANTQTEALFGLPRQHLIGKPVEVLIPERFRTNHPAHRSGFATDPK